MFINNLWKLPKYIREKVEKDELVEAFSDIYLCYLKQGLALPEDFSMLVGIDYNLKNHTIDFKVVSTSILEAMKFINISKEIEDYLDSCLAEIEDDKALSTYDKAVLTGKLPKQIEEELLNEEWSKPYADINEMFKDLGLEIPDDWETKTKIDTTITTTIMPPLDAMDMILVSIVDEENE